MDRISEQAEEFVRGWKAGGPAVVAQLRADAKLAAGGAEAISPPPFHSSPEHSDSDEDASLKEGDALTTASIGLPGIAQSAVRDHTVIQVTPRQRESDFAGMLHVDAEKKHTLVSAASSVYHPAAFAGQVSLRHTAGGCLQQIQLSFTRNLWKQAANIPFSHSRSWAGSVRRCNAGCINQVAIRWNFDRSLHAPFSRADGSIDWRIHVQWRLSHLTRGRLSWSRSIRGRNK